MTKEEIKTIVELFISWNGEKDPIDTSNLDSAVDYINECFKPSPPSNLDEAAEFDKMFEDFCDQHPDGLTLNECAEFFYDKGRQAGAEWMAGHGITKEAVIGMATHGGWKPYAQQIVALDMAIEKLMESDHESIVKYLRYLKQDLERLDA